MIDTSKSIHNLPKKNGKTITAWLVANWIMLNPDFEFVKMARLNGKSIFTEAPYYGKWITKTFGNKSLELV